MAQYEIKCPHCGTELMFEEEYFGQQCACPQCENQLTLAREAASPSADTPPVAPPAGPAPPAILPERMKANKAIAGRICSGCGRAIDFGDDVFNCQDCGESMHTLCYQSSRKCGNSACATPGPPPPRTDALRPLSVQATAEDTKPCKFCGEDIRKAARKCRFCGEYQTAADKPAAARKEAPPEDEFLTGSEIALGILCSGIACIVAIVYIVQGKKKGWKLLGISLVVQFVLGVIRAIVQSQI